MSDKRSDNRQKLQALLRELFQFDAADLDFGIYRILNHKREDIDRFIEQDLLDSVASALAQFQAQNREDLESELQELKGQLAANAFDEAGNIKSEALQFVGFGPRILELMHALEGLELAEETESRIFNDLVTFFSRYYDNGDFLSKRRFSSRGPKYVVPYNGEEVLLHWANRDQYYVKTSEYLTDYRFTAGDATVWFRLEEASLQQDNVKGDARYFVTRPEKPLMFDADVHSLTIFFEYRPLTEAEETKLLGIYNAAQSESKRRKKLDRKLLCFALEQVIVEELDDPTLKAGLAAFPQNKDSSLLGHHLNRYTARNTMDYFIHKDLSGFLGQELDFFLKNEVLMVDDVIGDQKAETLQLTMSRMRVVRSIAERIIAFLAQIEDFQKRMFEKLKFVTRTEYCITIDNVPKTLWPAVMSNDVQITEWRELYALDDLLAKTPLLNNGITEDILRQYSSLVVDTRHFDQTFKDRLLAAYDDLSAATDGMLIHSENWQALNLLAKRFRGQVKFIYIDPPYNTGDDGFMYKDAYQHSSWASLLFDRLSLAHRLLTENGCIAVSIGQEEIHLLLMLLDNVFGRQNLITITTVQRASVTGHKTINPGVVNISEYVLVYAKDRRVWVGNEIHSERERDNRYNNYILNREAPYHQWKFGTVLEAFAEYKGMEKAKLRKTLGDRYSSELDQFVYDNAASVIQLATVSVDDVGADFRDAVEESKRNPETVLYYQRTGFPDVFLLGGKKVLLYEDKLIRIGDRLATAERASDIWTDVLPNDIHNEGGVELKKGKKPEALIARLIEMGSDENDIVVDFFAGSATTLAVSQKMNRYWLGVEFANYFDEIAVTRMKNTLFGEQRGVSKVYDWQGGGFFQYLRLESYEDALNNILVHQPEGPQRSLLYDELDDYLLKYMLDFETKESPSLLTQEAFETPFAYRLLIQGGHQTPQPETVDLIETFHYLIGLHVRRLERYRHQERRYHISRGDIVTSTGIEKVIVIWRETEGLDLGQEADWAKETLLTEPVDRVYVNGPSFINGSEPLEITFRDRLEGGFRA